MSSLTYRSIGVDGESWPAWVRELGRASGVYVIKQHGDNGAVLYVGSSSGKLYDTITRHFQTWSRKKNFWKGMRGAHHDPGMTYNRSHCCVAVKLTSKGEHLEEEASLIQKLEPRDNLVDHPDGGSDDTPF